MDASTAALPRLMLHPVLTAVFILASLATSIAWCQPVGSPSIDPSRNESDAEGIPAGQLVDQGIDAWRFETAEIVDFVEPSPTVADFALESMATVLTWPDEPLAEVFGWAFRIDHVQTETVLSDVPLGIRPIPPRPNLLVEWNERFLGTGFLERGLEIPTGAVWRPAFWLFGQYRTAVQYTETDPGFTVAEWANRLDLFGQINLTGTERLLVGVRPLDEERGNRRDFSGYDLRDGRSTDGWNTDVQTLFFEADFQELFPNLDPYDFIPLDWSFSLGRMPVLAQQGLLVNEDMIDAVTITRDTLTGHGVLDLRMTGLYAWRGINRNSPTLRPNDFDAESRMVGLLTESDLAGATINVDTVYVGGSQLAGDLVGWGASWIGRHHGYHNTYNASVHVLASHPLRQTTAYADQGELLFGQFSWTPHHTRDLVYLNTFWAIDQYTSPARGPLQGGPLGQTGILFAGSGLGRFNAPLDVRTNNTAGASLGYQLFFDETRKQIISEIAGFKPTKGRVDCGSMGWALRLQSAAGQHSIFILDGLITKREGYHASPGARCELVLKF